MASDIKPADAAVDAVVIGGGPAGSSIGRLLAEWGHHVFIVSSAADPARGLAESLPPSTRKLLAAVGALEAVEAAGFYRTVGNHVWWGARKGRAESFADAAGTYGFQVFRPEFDRLLLDGARRAGARVTEQAVVRDVTIGGAAPSCVTYFHGGRRRTVAGRMIIDASGRSGVLARRGFRQVEPDHRTYALVGAWQLGDAADRAIGTDTFVETFSNGWAWSVPAQKGVRHAAVMIGRETALGHRGEAVAAAYHAELAHARHLVALLDDARLQRVWACDASPYAAPVSGGRDFLLIGDASSFIDPLSSFGVKKALASAWLGAITAHTCLTHPQRQGLAADFFSAQERRMYLAHRRQSREFAREAHDEHPQAFWAMRAQDRDEAANSGDDESQLLRAPEVQGIFRTLADSPAIDLVPADRIAVVPHPVVRGREIVPEPAFAIADRPEAIRFLGGVDLMTLCEMATRHRLVPDLVHEYCQQHAPAPLPALLAGLSFLVAHRILHTRGQHQPA